MEDDELLGASLTRALTATGYDATWAGGAADALSSADSDPPQLVLLDLSLPDGDGLDLCPRLLADNPGLVVIMLTARSEEADAVAGLSSGAVDYVTKPFRLAELLARVAAHLRFAAGAREAAREVSVGDLRVDLDARRVWVAGAEVDLRAKEFDLLTRLVHDAGKVVTREALISDVWDEHWFGSTKTLDVHIAASTILACSSNAAPRAPPAPGSGSPSPAPWPKPREAAFDCGQPIRRPSSSCSLSRTTVKSRRPRNARPSAPATTSEEAP